MSTLTAIDMAGEAVARLGETAWAEVPADELPGVMVELERFRARLDAARLEVADRLEQTEAATTVGWASTKDFLTAISGGRKGAGGGLLRLAAALRDLPATRQALADGWLSTDKARVITRRVGQLPHADELRGGAEQLLLERARDLDATDLDHAWPTVVAEIDPDHRLLGHDLSLPRAERAAHRARYLGFQHDQFGGVWLKGYGTAEDVELLKSALMPLAAPVSGTPGDCGGRLSDRTTLGDRGEPCPELGCAHDGRDPREFGVRLWDALVEACRRLQTAELLPASHGAVPRMLVSISLADLQSDLEDAGGLLPGGRPRSAAGPRPLAGAPPRVAVVRGAAAPGVDGGRAAEAGGHRARRPAARPRGRRWAAAGRPTAGGRGRTTDRLRHRARSCRPGRRVPGSRRGPGPAVGDHGDLARARRPRRALRVPRLQSASRGV